MKSQVGGQLRRTVTYLPGLYSPLAYFVPPLTAPCNRPVPARLKIDFMAALFDLPTTGAYLSRVNLPVLPPDRLY